ncbi:cell division protein ZapD [Rhabdochromatium marinum]|uniref:cell division protein ZapD n=1 Tax=Rhabdochromatium marinum TaxID=48729 RepID=UPI001907139F|nr:cell division protein ZapD [Rhabdochromatium marinum]
MTLFEHPLNERIRTFLRLEHLFEKFDHFRADESVWSTRAALESLLDILAITSRSDIKGELVKELDRNATALGRVRHQPGVDPAMLDDVLSRIGQSQRSMLGLTGQIGATARDDGFMKAIAQRSSIPGGACSFDLPHYHHLLTQPSEARIARLAHWSTELEPAKHAIDLTLSLIRSSNSPRSATARQGFFQETLDSGAPTQLIRVALDIKLNCFPEISGHRNRYSIRFLTAENGDRPTQTLQDIPFELTCCIF